jgi:hypothetical protein
MLNAVNAIVLGFFFEETLLRSISVISTRCIYIELPMQYSGSITDDGGSVLSGFVFIAVLCQLCNF